MLILLSDIAFSNLTRIDSRRGIAYTGKIPTAAYNIYRLVQVLSYDA